MPSFSNDFYGKLGIFKTRDNIKLPGPDTPAAPPVSPASPIVVTSPGVGNTAVVTNNYQYYTFTSSGIFNVTAPLTVDILVVAGGGSGASYPGSSGSGGGGGGGIVYVPNFVMNTDTYTVVVGAGSAGFSNSRGQSSSILTGAGTTLVTARGGGRGAGDFPVPASPAVIYPGEPGGSGGGGYNGATTGGSALPVAQPLLPPTGFTFFGNAGGSGFPTGGGGAGGGGAGGGGGGVGPNQNVGSGGGPGSRITGTGNEFFGPGIGVPALLPAGGFYSGGGGGGGQYRNDTFSAAGAGGAGGGGNGGRGRHDPIGFGGEAGANGLANSGGGGGGPGGGSPQATVSGLGGSGIVVIRLLVF